jgi:hypothetical protein
VAYQSTASRPSSAALTRSTTLRVSLGAEWAMAMVETAAGAATMATMAVAITARHGRATGRNRRSTR